MEEKKRRGERLWRKAEISFYRKKKGGMEGREKLRLEDAQVVAREREKRCSIERSGETNARQG